MRSRSSSARSAAAASLSRPTPASESRRSSFVIPAFRRGDGRKRSARDLASVGPLPAQLVEAPSETIEVLLHLRMAPRHALAVGEQVLLGDIGGVGGLGVPRQQVVEGLVLPRTDFGGNRI